MSKEIFKFKQFELSHARSSMRVGTDAVLLGAWAELPHESCRDAFGMPSGCVRDLHILDVGCGCGILALMAAQRFDGCQVLGIDVDKESVTEAVQNAERSPFAGRVRFVESDVRTLSENEYGRFSLILCNPPYYTEDTLPPDPRRSCARNAAHLSFGELLAAVSRLLLPDGVFAVIIPMQARAGFLQEAWNVGLHIRRECRVHTAANKESKRVLLEFCRGRHDEVEGAMSTLVLQDAHGGRSQEYSALCKDFYL